MESPEIFEKIFDSWANEMKDDSKSFMGTQNLLMSHHTDSHIKNLTAPDQSEYRKRWERDGLWISVIRGYGTYGASKGLFEMWGSCLEEPIGYLTSEQVLELGRKIIGMTRGLRLNDDKVFGGIEYNEKETNR